MLSGDVAYYHMFQDVKVASLLDVSCSSFTLLCVQYAKLVTTVPADAIASNFTGLPAANYYVRYIPSLFCGSGRRIS